MRLVTRADFDGLVCGALVTKFEKVDDYLYVEPKFMQDGLVEIRSGDIITNLPYHPHCTLWFDHHITNTTPTFEKPIILGRGGFRRLRCRTTGGLCRRLSRDHRSRSRQRDQRARHDVLVHHVSSS